MTSTIKATIDDNEENAEETMQQRIKDLMSIEDIKTKRTYDDIEEEKKLDINVPQSPISKKDS